MKILSLVFGGNTCQPVSTAPARNGFDLESIACVASSVRIHLKSSNEIFFTDAKNVSHFFCQNNSIVIYYGSNFKR